MSYIYFHGNDYLQPTRGGVYLRILFLESYFTEVISGIFCKNNISLFGCLLQPYYFMAMIIVAVLFHFSLFQHYYLGGLARSFVNIESYFTEVISGILLWVFKTGLFYESHFKQSLFGFILFSFYFSIIIWVEGCFKDIESYLCLGINISLGFLSYFKRLLFVRISKLRFN